MDGTKTVSKMAYAVTGGNSFNVALAEVGGALVAVPLIGLLTADSPTWHTVMPWIVLLGVTFVGAIAFAVVCKMLNDEQKATRELLRDSADERTRLVKVIEDNVAANTTLANNLNGLTSALDDVRKAVKTDFRSQIGHED